MIRLLIPVFSVILISGCSLLGDYEAPLEAGGHLLQTDRDSYEAQFVTEYPARVRFAIPYSTHNPTGEPLYLIGCRTPYPPMLEKWLDGTWQTAYAQVVDYCQSPPFEILAGEVRHDTLRVVGFIPGQDNYPIFETSIEGIYRLRRGVYAGLTDESLPRGNERLPLEQRVSNTFEVRFSGSKSGAVE